MSKPTTREEILECLEEPILQREEILEKWRAELDNGRPIIYTGCSAGIIARYAEKAGVDAIVVYDTGLSRHWGMPTAGLRDGNTRTFAMLDEVKNVVDHTPIVAGLEAYDPKYLGPKGLKRLLRKAIVTGFDGIQNCQTLIHVPLTIKLRDRVNVGFKRELELLELCKKLNIFTMWYACFPEQAKQVAEIGTDALVVHCGSTLRGPGGAKYTKKYAEIAALTPRARGYGIPTQRLDEATKQVQEMIEIVKNINKDIVCLAHGGRWANLEDVKYLFQHTDAEGFEAASSFERIPVESAIVETVKKFKRIEMKRK